jgi:hypothetical protein
MFEELRRIVSQMSGVPVERIARETRVGDLIDSLDLVELTVAIEEGDAAQSGAEFVKAARETSDEPFRFLEMTVGELADWWERYHGGAGS